MAAVLALIMLPLVASVGCFLSIVRSDGTLSSAFAAATVVALAGFVLVGALRIAREAKAATFIPSPRNAAFQIAGVPARIP